MFLSFVVAAVLVAALVDFVRVNWGWKGPWRLPLLRDLPATIYHFSEFHDYAYDLLSKTFRSDHLLWKIGLYDVLVITNPEDVKHLLKDNWKNYVVAKGLRGDALEDLLGDGIFHADGNHWLVQRKHASREFSAHIFRTFMTHEFREHSAKLIKRLAAAYKANSSPMVDLHGLFFKLTLDAFGKIAFGLSLGGLDDKPIPFAAAFDRAQELSAHRIAQKPPFLWKLQRMLRAPGEEREMRECLKVIDVFIQSLIRERKESKALVEKEDLLSKLMSASESDTEIEPQHRHSYLRDMTVNFIIAGRDTTACALSWFVYEMCKHPSVEERLTEELDLCLEGLDVSYDSLNQCQYLTACLHETLRLHPSVPFNPKTALKDDTFPCGVRIKGGDSVAYLPYAMGRMTSIWGSDAREFRPERWLDEKHRFVREDACKFTAFQAGPRVCLGLDMALLEMKVVVAMLLRAFRFELVEEPQYRVGMVLQMKHGLKVRFHPR